MAQVPAKQKAVVPNARLTVTATEAKTRFGSLLERAIQGLAVVITRHNTPKAVLLPLAEYEALTARRAPDLTAEFDALLASMQTPASRKARRAAFNASPKKLGRLASAGFRRRV